MARVTVEDCLEQVGNRFALTILGAERARQLAKGAQPLVKCDNKSAVTSLREIAEGKVKFAEDIQAAVVDHLAETRLRGKLTSKSHNQQLTAASHAAHSSSQGSHGSHS